MADRNYDIYTTMFICPIGLEYRLGENNNTALRFGAIFNNTSQIINDSKQINYLDPLITVTEAGNGNVIIDIDDKIYESTSERTSTTFSSTVFTYGLGYNPMENLQIDLLGFFGTTDNSIDNSIFDTSFYKNLRLSFTMKF